MAAWHVVKLDLKYLVRFRMRGRCYSQRKPSKVCYKKAVPNNFRNLKLSGPE